MCIMRGRKQCFLCGDRNIICLGEVYINLTCVTMVCLVIVPPPPPFHPEAGRGTICSQARHGKARAIPDSWSPTSCGCGPNEEGS